MAHFSYPHIITEVKLSPQPQKAVNQYVKLKSLGCGSFGKAFAALDRNDHRIYAMKQVSLVKLYKSPLGLAQLERAIELLRNLNHPNIIKLREVLYVKETASAYLVTDFCECGSLATIMKSGRLAARLVRSIFARLASAVAYLHGRRVIHQDIKPGNVFVSKEGNIVLGDFGLCHPFDTVAGLFGTAMYQAPEALDIDSDVENCEGGKEDVWSLGVTLYEMLFGATPFSGRNIYEIIACINEKKLVAPEAVDDDLWALIKGMLSVDPAQRVTMTEVMASEYVRGADDVNFGNLKELELPKIVDANAIFREEKGVVCGPGFKFKVDEELMKGDAMMRFRHASAPF